VWSVNQRAMAVQTYDQNNRLTAHSSPVTVVGMSRLLDNLPMLEKLLHNRRPFGLITDIDGTISPTSTDPLHVTIPPANRRYLRAFSERLDLVAVISGRSATEVRALVDGDNILCIGHYGMERWQDGAARLDSRVKPYYLAVRQVASRLTPLSAFEGVVLQDKGATVSIHYRLSPHPEETKQRILAFLENLPQIRQLRILPENMVIGIIPPVAIDKGTAVRDLIKERHLNGAMYLGDDVADVRGFDSIHEANRRDSFRGVAIAVTGAETAPEVSAAADFTLDGVKETTELLKWLVVKLTLRESGTPT